MYAVIESGGKQYRVELGAQIQVDRLDANAGDTITLDRVLLVADGDDTAIGRPIVDGASVKADVVGQDRGEKIVVFKYKPKARTRVKNGFRAELTTLRIADISYGGRSAAKDAEKTETKKAKEAAAAEKAATEKATADADLAAQLAAGAGEAKPASPKKKSASGKTAADTEAVVEAATPTDDAIATDEASATANKKAPAKKKTIAKKPTEATDVVAEDVAPTEAAGAANAKPDEAVDTLTEASEPDSSSTESGDAKKDE